MKLKLLAVAAAAAALVTPAAAAEAAKGQLSRPTFIDPEVVAQLPHDLAQQMIRDRDTFYVPDGAEVVGSPQRMRFAEARDARPTPIGGAAPPAAAAKPAPPAKEEAEPRRETRRSAGDDARRRRDYAAWEMRRQELEAEQVEHRLAAEAQPRFQQARGPQQAPRAAANDDEDDADGQDTDDDLTPAQAQLENNRRRARKAERQAAVDAARRQANHNAAMRFAEARRSARPLVRAYPPSTERGTPDLAGNVMQSRLARAEARRQERERPQVLLETGAERPHRRMFEMSPEELHAAFQAHRAGAPAAPAVAERETERREAGPAGMPRMAPPPAPRRQPGDAALLEEHGIRVTHYEPPVRA